MGNSFLQLIALAAVAIFLIYRLRNTLGKRDGYESVDKPLGAPSSTVSKDSNLDDPKIDRDITKHVDSQSDSATALAKMKNVDTSFLVSEFIDGAGKAYPMILLAFASGTIEEIRSFVSDEVFESFREIIQERSADAVCHQAKFVGLREARIREVSLNNIDEAEITIEFVSEMVYYVQDEAGNIIEGDEKTVRRQRDVWTFARNMNSSDPNWKLVATGE